MNKYIFALALFSFLTGSAYSPIAFAGSAPPSYYLAEKIAKRKQGLDSAILQVELLHAGNAQEKTGSNRIWQGNIHFVEGRPRADKSAWPLLALLLESDPQKLMNALKSFGIPMQREEELVNKRARADAKANPEADIVFYKTEESLSVRRWKDRIAWQVAGTEKEKKFFVEKDAFNALALTGPCPSGFGSSFLGGGNEPCSLEFHYDAGMPMQIPGSVVLLVGDREALTLKISRVIANPPEKLVKDLVKTNQESLDSADELAATFHSQFLR